MSPFIEDFRRKYKILNNNEAFFKGFVNDTEMMLGIKTAEFSSLTRMPTSTIERWKRGESSPHPLARISVIEFIRKALVV